jgi:GTPase SAR1 family protein
MFRYEDGLAAMAALKVSPLATSSDRNEATTRFQLIDQIFFGCLGWSAGDVTMEESHGGEYADYTFHAPRRALIVEAKREGISFDLPAGETRTELPIANLIRDNSAIKSAVEQVRNYCHDRGVQFACVANGHQLIAFIASRSDGVPPLEGRAMVFTSLEHMHSGFRALWDSLSKASITEKRLSAKLVGAAPVRLPEKFSASVHDFPGIRKRNVFQTDLQILADLIIEDVARSRELEGDFLRECYCPSGAFSQYAFVSKDILASRYDALFPDLAAAPTLIPAVKKEKISSDLLADSLSRRPILLLGDVGVGKSTFLQYLAVIEAKEEFKNSVLITLNLGSRGALSKNFKSFVVPEIERQLLDVHEIDVYDRAIVRATYDSELRRFKRSIHGDLEDTDLSAFRTEERKMLARHLEDSFTHIGRVLEHVAKGRKKQVVIFIDNVDQRSESDQQEAFLVGQALAENWPCVVFITLRPETFYLSHRTGALSGYHPRAFTIAPPRIDRVLKRRLEFARKICSGRIAASALSQTSGVQLQSLDLLIEAFLDSIDSNSELIEFLENISGGNVRLTLDLVRGFFGSGHVDTQSIVEIMRRQGDYRIPYHQFLRAVMFGDHEFYDPETSPILNLFDINQPDPRQHFLCAILLKTLSVMAPNGKKGFVEIDDLYDKLQGFGFVSDQIDFAVARCLQKKAAETSNRLTPIDGQDTPRSLRVTSLGLYHTDRLASSFAYVDAVITDIPLLDGKTRGKITNAQDIMLRADRVAAFREYMDSIWAALQHSALESGFDWNSTSNELLKDIEGVKRRAQRREWDRRASQN